MECFLKPMDLFHVFISTEGVWKKGGSAVCLFLLM